MASPRNVIAVTPGGDITLDMLLGFYSMFSIPETPVSVATLRRIWTREGEDPDLLPKHRKAVHAFQVACRSIESRRQSPENGNLRTTEVKVDEVMETEDECVYQVTRLVRDREHRVIEHPKAMRLVFNKLDQTISADALDKREYKALSHLEDAVRTHFEENANKLPGAKIRSAIRSILDELGATKVVRSGVYFVPRAGHTRLEGLQAIIEEAYGERGELHLIPCANAEGEKQMVARHFTTNATQSLDRLMSDVTGYLKDRNGDVRIDKLRNIVAQRRTLATSAEKYMDLLDNELDEVRERLTLVDDQIEALYVKAGKRLDTED